MSILSSPLPLKVPDEILPRPAEELLRALGSLTLSFSNRLSYPKGGGLVATKECFQRIDRYDRATTNLASRKNLGAKIVLYSSRRNIQHLRRALDADCQTLYSVGLRTHARILAHEEARGGGRETKKF
jgi:hypothetical protein